MVAMLATGQAEEHPAVPATETQEARPTRILVHLPSADAARVERQRARQAGEPPKGTGPRGGLSDAQRKQLQRDRERQGDPPRRRSTDGPTPGSTPSNPPNPAVDTRDIPRDPIRDIAPMSRIPVTDSTPAIRDVPRDTLAGAPESSEGEREGGRGKISLSPSLRAPDPTRAAPVTPPVTAGVTGPVTGPDHGSVTPTVPSPGHPAGVVPLMESLAEDIPADAVTVALETLQREGQPRLQLGTDPAGVARLACRLIESHATMVEIVRMARRFKTRSACAGLSKTAAAETVSLHLLTDPAVWTTALGEVRASATKATATALPTPGVLPAGKPPVDPLTAWQEARKRAAGPTPGPIKVRDGASGHALAAKEHQAPPDAHPGQATLPLRSEGS